jgi:flagellar biogenesis protein FliO
MMGISKFNIAFDFAIVSLFAIVMILIGTYAFKKMKIKSNYYFYFYLINL